MKAATPARPIRVLYAALSLLRTSSNFGGSHRILYRLMRSLDRERFEPAVLASGGDHLARMCAEAGIPCTLDPRVAHAHTGIHRLAEAGRRRAGVRSGEYGATVMKGKPSLAYEFRKPISVLFSSSRMLRIRRHLREARVDLVHGEAPDPHLIVACRLEGVPLLAHLFSQDLCFALDRFLSRWVGTYVAESEICAAHWKRSGLPESKVVTLFNGIDAEELREPPAPPAELRARFGLPKQGPIITYIARFVRWKGHLEFVQAAPRILAQCPDACFVLVGDGDKGYTAELREAAAKGGVTDRMRFLGHVDDLPAILHASDVSVHFPTQPESMPTILLDSMAAGRTIVSCDTEETREVVGDTALLATPNDTQALADAVVRALALDPAARDDLTRRARTRVVERFSDTALARAIAPYYEALVKEG